MTPQSRPRVEFEMTPVVRGVHIKAATLECLVLEMLDSFDPDSDRVLESRAQFVTTLLRMHKWFTTSLELFNLLTRNLITSTENEEIREGDSVASANVSENTSGSLCCTCSDLAVRRRNNRSLSNLNLDNSTLGLASEHRESNYRNSYTNHEQSQSLQNIVSNSNESTKIDHGITASSHTDIIKQKPRTPDIKIDGMTDSFLLNNTMICQSHIAHGQGHTAYDKMYQEEQTTPSSSFPMLCRRACLALSYWMQLFPLHFDSDADLYAAVEHLKQHLYENNTDLYNLVEPCHVPSYDWMRKVTAKNSDAAFQRTESHSKVSLVFQNLGAEDLAKHLSYIDYKVCRRISFTDYQSYARSGSMNGVIRLERSVTIFNGLTQWVQLMVLSKTHPRQRAAIITKFVKVSQHLVSLKSYNTFMAIIGGVTHSSIARLHKTQGHLTSEIQRLLTDLTEIVSSHSNYQSYRRALSQIPLDSVYALPIIGIHLKDLIALHSAHTDTVGEEPEQMINFRKMAQLSNVISCLTRLQDQSPPYTISTDLVDTLKLALDVFYSEEEIFELSLAREPRANCAIAGNIPGATPSPHDQLNLLSEWRSSIKPPNKATIDKHVSNMVTAIFRNYDLDRDGCISVEEFETISSNFPFIESFCVLDVNEDGLLSEKEVKKYFMLAKCNSLKRSFKHNFTETTYFKLTYCDHCSGLLWGLIKQGWKCRDCSINAHKSCKDRVVMDCKSRATANSSNGLASTSSRSSSSVFPNSGSNTSLNTSSISPLTPSTPEFTHGESRFTFSRASAKSWSFKEKLDNAATSTGSIQSNMSEDTGLGSTHHVASKTSQPAKSAHGSTCLAEDNHVISDQRQLTAKLQEYEERLRDTDKALKEEINEKKQLNELCMRHANEIRVLKRQLLAMRKHTVSLILTGSSPQHPSANEEVPLSMASV